MKNKKKSNILFFDFATLNYCGGAEKNFMNLGKWLEKKSYQITYITGSKKINDTYHKIMGWGKHNQNISDTDLKETYSVKGYNKFNLIDLVLPTKKRKEIISQLNTADTIISKNEILELIPILYLFKTSNKRIVVVFHTPINYPKTDSLSSKLHNAIYTSKIYTHFLKDKRILKLIFTSPNLTLIEKNLIKSSNNFNKSFTIPNPIDTEKFYLKNKVKKKKFKIYYIGRMTEQKGIDVLVNAIKITNKNKNFKKMQFNFVGSGTKETLLNELNKYSNCKVLGFKKEIVKFYQDADILIAPSRWEGFPHALLEAQSTGTPAITTNIPGCRDIIINNYNGWTVNSEDYYSLNQLILKTYNLWKFNFKKFIKYGKRGRERIIKNYSQDIINNKIERLICEGERPQ